MLLFLGTIFAYGQTASGKTYTMMGDDKSLGIIPLAVLELFSIIKKVRERERESTCTCTIILLLIRKMIETLSFASVTLNYIMR